MGLLRIIFENLCNDQQGTVVSITRVYGRLDGSVWVSPAIFHKDDEMILKQNNQIRPISLLITLIVILSMDPTCTRTSAPPWLGLRCDFLKDIPPLNARQWYSQNWKSN